jgi:Ca2+-binding RTX toxin-like protein
MLWLTKLLDRGMKGKVRARRRPLLEPLEERLLLSTTMFLDFGAGVGVGNTLDTTAAAYRDIFGANTGTDLTDNGLAGGDTLRLAPLGYDFDLNSVIDNNDLTALANAVLPLAQRALEPFDIDLVIGNAANLADAVTAVGANAGDATGEFDAYVFIMTATSDFGVGGGPFLAAVAAGLFGEAAVADMNAQAGNDRDEAALTFADNIFNSTTGVQGTAAFNVNLAQRFAYTAVHEAFHTLTYRHTPDEQGGGASADQRLLASGDVIRRGSVTREDPFIVTRYDLLHGIVVAEPNNYLLAANDADIGLRDANANGTPDLAYVTGTGANDVIGLTDAGGGIVNVAVNPFNNQARTTAIGAGETYTLDLASETDGTILVDAGVNADEVELDVTIDATFRLRGGEGADSSVSATADQDLLTLQGGGLTGIYTPGAAEAGSVNYAGGASIFFSEFEDIEANGIPIVVSPLTLSDMILDEGDTLDLSGSFVNIDTLDTHEVVISWGDGSPDTVLVLAAGVRNFAASHLYRDDNPTGTSADGYLIAVTLTDEDDGVGSAGANVTVNNVAPEIDSISFSATEIDEGDAVTVTGTFSDPALGVPSETFNGTASWSDGVATVLMVNADGTFSTLRLFPDDHPSTGTPFDLFTVTIEIGDDDLGSDSEVSAVLTVNNVDPVIQAFESDATFADKGEEGEPVNVSGSFTDIGVLDTHSAMVDWGDGSVEALALVQGAGSGTVQGSHAYAAGGIYTITLTVTDDDTGSHQMSTLAVITGVGLNNGVLYVIGSAEDDTAHIHQTGNGSIKVHASFIPEPFREFDADEVEEIISYLCQGDDRLTIAGNVRKPAIVHGDAGDDHLHGGGGPTVLLGGSGNDTLIGQSGSSILIGGTGRDRLVGGHGGDLLIGGSTTFDHNQDAALSSAVALWADPLAPYEERATAVDAFLAVADDGDADKLTGSAGQDLFYAGIGDVPTDQKAAELDGAALPLMAAMATGASQDGVEARTVAPTIDWTANGWSAGALAGSRPVTGAGVADFLVLTAQPKSGRGQDARQGG